MKTWLAPVFALVLVAGCTAEDEKRPSTPYTPTPKPETTTSITAAIGGTATSEDGKLRLEIPANALSADATVTITEDVTDPAPAVSLSNTYEIAVTPTTAVESGTFTASLIFTLTAADLGSTEPNQLTVASGSNVGDSINAWHAGTYDTVAEEYTASTNHLSYFLVLDQMAYSSCSCNTTAACDVGCAFCDPDCLGCTCDVTGNCDAQCECDEDCGCTCDVTSACDADCECDTDCYGCQCDVSGACDSECDCDIDCFAECNCDFTDSCDDCWCDANCSDTGGIYPYPTCNAETACTAGYCMTGNICVGICHQSPTSCGEGFACEEGVCVKYCIYDEDCRGNNGLDCCEEAMCTPAVYCPGETPAEWTCSDYYYDADDGCECGCNAPDPDCGNAGCSEPGCTANGCEFCHDADGAEFDCDG